MESKTMQNSSWSNFKWFNEPDKWFLTDNILEVSTNLESDFWQETYYKFKRNSGHVFGKDVRDNFTMQVCVEANFETLYDQAGVMIYIDEGHWLKAGIEYNDGQSMMGSVLTDKLSDWATGTFNGNPKKFWMRATRRDGVVCVKYSSDNTSWHLLRLCPFPEADGYFVGVMCCSPKRSNLTVRFSDITFSTPAPADDILHCN